MTKLAASKQRGAVPARVDSRAEAGARKRQRMRVRILEATLQVCAEFGSKPIVVDDILAAAEISRGTFYLHFDSLYSAMTAVAKHLGDDLQQSMTEFCRDIDDPLLLVTMSFQAVLTRASLDALWGRAFAFSKGFPQVGQDAIREELLRGRSLGLFRFDDIDAAMTVHVGASLQAARILGTQAKGQARFIEELATIYLRALGAPKERAIEAVRWASDRLRTETSKMPTWLTISSRELPKSGRAATRSEKRT